jgi:hypothetical protein
MANNSVAVSALPTASNLASTDRVLILYNAVSNAAVANGIPSVRTIPVSNFLVSNSSISSNGYAYLPNGIKMNWGQFVCNTTSQIVFSDSFPTAVVSMTVTPQNNVYVGANTPYVFSSNTTTANVYSASTTNTANCYFMAIGY